MVLFGLQRAKKAGVELTKVSVVTGAGSTVIGSLGGGQVTSNAQQGLSSFSRGFGPAGSILGGRLNIDLVQDLKPRSRKRKK